MVGAARDVVPRGRRSSSAPAASRRSATIHATSPRGIARRRRSARPHAGILQVADDEQRVFVAHYTAVADASPVPVLLYNFTAVTGVTLPTRLLRQLATHPNIVGMKESAATFRRSRISCRPRRRTSTSSPGRAATFYEALMRRRRGRHPRAGECAPGGVRPSCSS